MGRRRVVMAIASAAAAWGALLAAPAGAEAGVGPAAWAGSWQRAVEVPGLGALNAGGDAEVLSVSCPSAGSCAAGGYYTSRSGDRQAFVVSKRDGRWHRAVKVPGTGVLNAGGDAAVSSVSCARAGDCAAGGSYTDGNGSPQVFVAVERDGRWQQAVEVPGSAALNAGGSAAVNSVSCGSAGDCAAGGYYTDSFGDFQAFVATERDGRWRRAARVPGTGAPNAGGEAAVNSVSCASAGSCVAGIFSANGAGRFKAFVVSERDGRWRRAIKVPAPGAGGGAEIFSVSCGSAGNCAAGGNYAAGSGQEQAFVVTERDGRWRRAIEVPGSGALNAGGNAVVTSVSCASAGNCAAGGSYASGAGRYQAFVVVERDGRWRRAIPVPGSSALNAGGSASVASVSCASAGSCAAGGNYTDGSGDGQAFVATEQNGRWRRAIKVPGSGALNAGGYAVVNSVSCASAGNCAAGGRYLDGSGRTHGFVASRT